MNDAIPIVSLRGAELHLVARLSLIDSRIEGGISVPDSSGDGGREHYAKDDSSAYVVRSLVDRDQILDTKNKIMDEDLTVERVRSSEVSNIQGGITVNIA